MNYSELVFAIEARESVLCVGLDTDLDKLPRGFSKGSQSMLDFNKAIVDATAPYAVAYKPNLAFYEALGLEGWKVLEQTLLYIKTRYPGHFTIADAKRGDIGNTATMYAKGLLENMGFDSLTVAPYMGEDSVKPFLLPDKWAIVLALTSNGGSSDFQMQPLADQAPLYQKVLERVQEWGSPEQLMFVVGATHSDELAHVRSVAPNHFFLVPGVGAQGGSVSGVLKTAAWRNKPGMGVLVNASRSILYASSGTDFAQKAALEAKKMQSDMALFMETSRPLLIP